VIGVNADAKVGPATVSGFLAAQVGNGNFDKAGKLPGATGFDAASFKRHAVSGYAANVAAKLAVGPGTLKTGALFLTGDSDLANGNNTSWTSTGSSTYAEGGMFLLVRTGVGGTNNDRSITGAILGNPRGMILYTAGFDAAITPKLYANTNLGVLWAAKNNTAPVDGLTTRANVSNFMGAELNLETGYKVYDNLTAKVQLAYVMLGGYYKHSARDTDASKSPEDPYTARVGLSYAF
jgi:hypothetical protein